MVVDHEKQAADMARYTLGFVTDEPRGSRTRSSYAIAMYMYVRARTTYTHNSNNPRYIDTDSLGNHMSESTELFEQTV